MKKDTVPKIKLSETRKATERSQRRWKIGCFGIIFAVVGLLMIAFIGVERNNERWTLARPQSTSESDWAKKREMCERIDFQPAECGLRSNKEVEALSIAVLRRELQEICANDNPAPAVAEAERIVLAGLKAPASADFINGSERTTHDGCSWAVSGEVDAQNSFGAQIRSSYYVKLRRVGKDTWLPLEVRIP